MSKTILISIAIGLFFGHWIITPWLYKGQTHKDGFYTGILAAAIVLLLGLIAFAH